MESAKSIVCSTSAATEMLGCTASGWFSRDGGDERLLAHGVLVEPGSAADMGRECDIDAFIVQQPFEVFGEDLPRSHVQLGFFRGRGRDQCRQRLVDGGEGVREP